MAVHCFKGRRAQAPQLHLSMPFHGARLTHRETVQSSTTEAWTGAAELQLWQEGRSAGARVDEAIDSAVNHVGHQGPGTKMVQAMP